MRGLAACAVGMALATHAAGETRVVTGQALVTGTYQSHTVRAVSNTVVATAHAQPKVRRDDARQEPEKDNDKGMGRGPGRVPAAKRTR